MQHREFYIIFLSCTALFCSWVQAAQRTFTLDELMHKLTPTFPDHFYEANFSSLNLEKPQQVLDVLPLEDRKIITSVSFAYNNFDKAHLSYILPKLPHAMYITFDHNKIETITQEDIDALHPGKNQRIVFTHNSLKTIEGIEKLPAKFNTTLCISSSLDTNMLQSWLKKQQPTFQLRTAVAKIVGKKFFINSLVGLFLAGSIFTGLHQVGCENYSKDIEYTHDQRYYHFPYYSCLDEKKLKSYESEGLEAWVQLGKKINMYTLFFATAIACYNDYTNIQYGKLELMKSINDKS